MAEQSALSRDVLALDCEKVAAEVEAAVRDQVVRRFRKRGAVVGISGGIDSSVVAALCARALGPDHVLGLLMPEGESAEQRESLELAQELVRALGIRSQIEDITATLEGAGCYRRRDAALREVIPDYGPGWKSKIVLPDVVESDRYRLFSVVARAPDGREVKVRLPLDAYLTVVAATNFKQRTRTMMEYFHADRLNYAVAGTPNRLEYDQGFFVKGGDGLADFKPIAHLYKSQVYALAAQVGVPASIRKRPPTTDTYSLPQSQEEFYFSLPYEQMDLCLWARDHGVDAEPVAAALGYTAAQIERVFRDIDAKRRFAAYLHAPAALFGDLAGSGR